MIDRKDIVLALQITRSSFIEVAFHEAKRFYALSRLLCLSVVEQVSTRVVETLRLKGELTLFRTGSMLPKNSDRTAMRRIIFASFAWALLFFGSTWLIAMLYPAVAIEGKIPVGSILLSIAVGGISIPTNLAIHGVVLEHIFRVKRKRTFSIGMSIVQLAAASIAIGLSLVASFARSLQ